MGVWRDRRDYERMCGTKEIFFSKKECDDKVRTISNAMGEKGLASYQCPYCNWWHYGHTSESERT